MTALTTTPQTSDSTPAARATKAAIVVLSDPKAGEEALGRLFNALAAAYDFKTAGEEVTILFQGAGTRWLEQVTRPDHPAYDLFTALADTVAGASCGCAEVFGATEGVERSGFDLIKECAVPGTSGVTSLSRLIREGFTVLTF